jgi:transcriptional regulator with XRE-family HTH domain
LPSALGTWIRTEREGRGIGLREFAGRVKKSPAFLVRLETDQQVPAVAEETLVTIADALQLDRDRVFALARKVPKELVPEDALDLAVYRMVKRMSRAAKRRLLQRGAGRRQ